MFLRSFVRSGPYCSSRGHAINGAAGEGGCRDLQLLLL